MSISQHEEVRTKFFVEYTLWIPHSSKTQTVPTHSRGVRTAIKNAPNDAYSFRFYQREEVTRIIDGEQVVETSEPKRLSGWHFINGLILDRHHLDRAGMNQAASGEFVKTRFDTTVPFIQGKDKIVQS